MRKSIVLAGLFAGCCVFAGQKPNIIVLLADDAGFGDYQPYHRFFDIKPEHALQTPNIQKLADEGMLFTNGHSTGAVCQPSRYSIMSGIFSFRKLVSGNPSAEGGEPFIDPDKRMCIGDMLKQAGYRTGIVGKWHLDYQFEAADTPGKVTHKEQDFSHVRPVVLGPEDYGFDYTFWSPKGVGGNKFCVENRRVVKLTGQDEYTKVHPDRSPWPGHKRWQTVPCESEADYVEMPPDERKILCDLWADKALDFMEKAAQDDRPFFLYVASTAPHAPHLPDDEMNGTPFAKGAKLANGKVSENSRQTLAYANDIILGQLTEQLKRLGIEKNTIVIFTADNGGGTPGLKTMAMGDFNGHKGLGHEGGNRMPYIVKWPGVVKPGSVSDELVSQVDFFKTFAAVAGVTDLPADVAPDSLDILPVLAGTGKSPRSLHFATKHKLAPYDAYEEGTRNVAMLDAEGNKLILHFVKEGEYTPVEYYRLDRDPAEKNNLIHSPEFKGTIRRLVDEFDAVRQKDIGEG